MTPQENWFPFTPRLNLSSRISVCGICRFMLVIFYFVNAHIRRNIKFKKKRYLTHSAASKCYACKGWKVSLMWLAIWYVNPTSVSFCFVILHTRTHTHTHTQCVYIAHPMRPQTRLACVSFNLSSLCSRRLSCLPILIFRYAVAFPVFPTLAADFGLKWEFCTYILIQPPTHIHRQAHKSTDLLRLLVLCLTVIFYFFH